jgi:hypothetical protein
LLGLKQDLILNLLVENFNIRIIHQVLKELFSNSNEWKAPFLVGVNSTEKKKQKKNICGLDDRYMHC